MAATTTAAYSAYAAAAVAAAGTTTQIVMENNSRKQNLRQLEKQKKAEEDRRKNLLEEQLARRRARVGSMGISSTGSVIASQSKLVGDAYKDIAMGNTNYDDKSLQTYNSYYSKLNNQIIDNTSRMIK